MKIQKGTVVWVSNRSLIPFGSRICLVIEADSDLDGWFDVIDCEGTEIASRECDLIALAQSKADTKNLKEAVATCYEEVIASLETLYDVAKEEV